MYSSRLACLCLTTLAISSIVGCSTNPWRQEVISSDERIFLYREHKEIEGAKTPLGHAHPVEVSARDVEALLTHLVWMKKTVFADPQPFRMFSPQECASYSEPIAKALATLTPDQRLRFLVPETSLSNIFYGATGTSGVIFASSEGTLDIAFDTIHAGINDGDGGRPEEVLFAHDPTELTQVASIIPFEGSRRKVDAQARRNYPGWLVVDRKALAGLPEKIASADSRTVANSNTGRDSDLDGGTDLDKGTEPGKAAASDPDADPVTQPEDEDPHYVEIRRKIENLKRLKADGAITEEEYKKQFDELMKDL